MKQDKAEYYRPSIVKYTAIAWSSIALFSALLIWGLLQGELIASLVFLFFAALAFLLIAIAVRIEIGSEATTVHSIFAKYRMTWSEVELIEVGTWVFVFHGRNKKRLIVPMVWSGEQAKSTTDFLDKQINLFEIRVIYGLFADYKIHKNVRTQNI